MKARRQPAGLGYSVEISLANLVQFVGNLYFVNTEIGCRGIAIEIYPFRGTGDRVIGGLLDRFLKNRLAQTLYS